MLFIWNDASRYELNSRPQIHNILNTWSKNSNLNQTHYPKQIFIFHWRKFSN